MGESAATLVIGRSLAKAANLLKQRTDVPDYEMLRLRLQEQFAEKEFREHRGVTTLEIADATGIHRMTLSKLANHRGYNPTADTINRLCTHFGCRIEQLVEHLPDEAVTGGRDQK